MGGDGGKLQLLMHYINQDGLGFAAGTKKLQNLREFNTSKACFSFILCVHLGCSRALLNMVIQGPRLAEAPSQHVLPHIGEGEVMNCSVGLTNSVGNDICLYDYILLANINSMATLNF